MVDRGAELVDPHLERRTNGARAASAWPRSGNPFCGTEGLGPPPLAMGPSPVQAGRPRARPVPSSGHVTWLSVSAARLLIIAGVCLVSFVALALAVSHGTAPYGFEDPVIDRLGSHSAIRTWEAVLEVFGYPVGGVILVACLGFGLARGAAVRVVLYAVLAGAALLISEHLAKPLVHRTYYEELTFPSGHVTAACSTAFAMWLALFPLLEKRARTVTGILGAAWVVLVSVAVVGALWHTPLDAVGSVLLSVGIVSAGGAILELPVVRDASFMGEGRSGTGSERGRSGPTVEELLTRD